MKPITYAKILLVLAFLPGCAGSVERATPEEAGRAFPFIVDGATRKADFEQRGFGEPDRAFENGRIRVYSVRQDKFGAWRIDESADRRIGKTHDLILVFSPDGVVERHGLVLAR